MSVHIGKKSKQGRIFHGKRIFAVLVQVNPEVSDTAVTVFLDHLNQAVDHLVQFRVLKSPGFEYILDFHGIRKLIVGQYIAVSVINIASCTGNVPCFLNLEDKIIQILLSLYNLQFKTPINQNSSKQDEKQCKNSQPACDNTDYLIFKFIKQTFVLSFFPMLPASYLPLKPMDTTAVSPQLYTMPPAILHA